MAEGQDHRRAATSPAARSREPDQRLLAGVARDRQPDRPVPAAQAGRGVAARERGALPQPHADVVRLLLGDRRRSTASSTVVHGPDYLPTDMGRGVIGQAAWDLPSMSPDDAGWAAHRAPPSTSTCRSATSSSAAPHARRHGALLLDQRRPALRHRRQFLGYRGVGRDITEIALARERIASLAYTRPADRPGQPHQPRCPRSSRRCSAARRENAQARGGVPRPRRLQGDQRPLRPRRRRRAADRAGRAPARQPARERPGRAPGRRRVPGGARGGRRIPARSRCVADKLLVETRAALYACPARRPASPRASASACSPTTRPTPAR